MRLASLAGCAALSVMLFAWGCGGGSSYTPSPSPSPSPTPTPTPSAGTVDIVGIQGNRSFNPNPSTLPADRQVSFHNADGVVHRIVANDGSFDSGNIPPGSTSTAVPVDAGGANYHCSIHPSMIGVINAESGTTPPCTGQYCSEAPAGVH